MCFCLYRVVIVVLVFYCLLWFIWCFGLCCLVFVWWLFWFWLVVWLVYWLGFVVSWWWVFCGCYLWCWLLVGYFWLIGLVFVLFWISWSILFVWFGVCFLLCGCLDCVLLKCRWCGGVWYWRGYGWLLYWNCLKVWCVGLVLLLLWYFVVVWWLCVFCMFWSCRLMFILFVWFWLGYWCGLCWEWWCIGLYCWNWGDFWSWMSCVWIFCFFVVVCVSVFLMCGWRLDWVWYWWFWYVVCLVFCGVCLGLCWSWGGVVVCVVVCWFVVVVLLFGSVRMGCRNCLVCVW